MNDSKQIVRDVIQRIWGYPTPTSLDAEAADEILAALRQAGWAAPEEIALLIKAAGGQVVITRKMREEFGRGWQIERWDDPAADSTIVRVRESARGVEWTVKS